MNKVWSIWIINEYYEQTFTNGVYEHNMNKNMNIIWILLTDVHIQKIMNRLWR